MTVSNDSVVEGSTIKARCEERRVEVGSVCYLDWCRFTISCAAIKLPIPFRLSLPYGRRIAITIFGWPTLPESLEAIRQSSDDHACAIEQAFLLPARLPMHLVLILDRRIKQGSRLLRAPHSPFCFNDSECGSVMCWSSSDSKRQRGQRDTVNVNLHGSA